MVSLVRLECRRQIREADLQKDCKDFRDKVTLFILKVTQGFSCEFHGYFLWPLFLESLPSMHEQSTGNGAVFGLKHARVHACITSCWRHSDHTEQGVSYIKYTHTYTHGQAVPINPGLCLLSFGTDSANYSWCTLALIFFSLSILTSSFCFDLHNRVDAFFCFAGFFITSHFSLPCQLTLITPLCHISIGAASFCSEHLYFQTDLCLSVFLSLFQPLQPCLSLPAGFGSICWGCIVTLWPLAATCSTLIWSWNAFLSAIRGPSVQSIA